MVSAGSNECNWNSCKISCRVTVHLLRLAVPSYQIQANSKHTCEESQRLISFLLAYVSCHVKLQQLGQCHLTELELNPLLTNPTLASSIHSFTSEI